MRALDPAVRTAVIPNGVDADEYAPSEDVPRDQGLIVLTGAMDYPPNEQAAAFVAREVLPLIRAEQPDAWLALVGRHPSAAVLALGELDGVEVTGEVPDVRPWLWRAEAFACLMRSGTGIKNKLLEALAAGTPCVATPLATQGMAVEHGEHLLIAESAEASAHALGRLLVDAELRDRLGRAGREYVLRTHSWAAMARAYAELYERAVSEASARA